MKERRGQNLLFGLANEGIQERGLTQYMEHYTHKVYFVQDVKPKSSYRVAQRISLQIRCKWEMEIGRIWWELEGSARRNGAVSPSIR